MADTSAPNFTVKLIHTQEPGRAEEILAALATLEAKMSELSDYVVDLKAAVDELKARITADVAELQRLIAAGISTDAQKAEAMAVLDDLRGIDPVTDFPPAPGEPIP